MTRSRVTGNSICKWRIVTRAFKLSQNVSLIGVREKPPAMLVDIYLQVTKGLGKCEVDFSYDSDIKKNFSHNVVQSYYEVSSKKR